MEFQVIYSRKIQGAVILFTVFMFACQYGLTRETVAENFSRTGICWSEFALNVVFSILLIFLVWDDDYQMRALQFEELFFVKNINGMNSLIVEFVIKKMKMQMIEMKNYCTFQINPSQIVNSKKCIMS